MLLNHPTVFLIIETSFGHPAMKKDKQPESIRLVKKKYKFCTTKLDAFKLS